MDPILLLALVTFVLVLAFLVWNRMSVAKNKKSLTPAGVGGPNDPLAGETEGLRNPREMRAEMNAASGVAPGAAEDGR